MLCLIFWRKCGLIMMRVARAPPNKNFIHVDDGRRRFAQSEAEGISTVSLPQQLRRFQANGLRPDTTLESVKHRRSNLPGRESLR